MQKFQQQIESRLTPTTNSPRLPYLNDEDFAAQYLYILDKGRERKRLLYNPAQRQLIDNLTGKDIVLKARQLGISTAIQARLFRLATTKSAATITLSHEDETTQKLRRMADFFYEHMPENERPPRKYSNARLTTYPTLSSEAVIATAGNKDTGRGGTYTHLHGSEVAFWADAARLVAGAMQGGNPEVILESTPNGAQGYFYDLCMEALDGNNKWRLHFFAWWVDPEYRLPLQPDERLDYSADELMLIERYGLSAEQIKWRRDKQHDLKSMFPQEYPEDPQSCFLLSGMGYFGDLSHCFTAPLNATRQDGHLYVAGLDFGQQNDYTVCSVIDVTARAQVDLLRINKLSWSEMRRKVRDVCKAWDVRVLTAEANSMGSTNIEALAHEFDADGCNTNISAFQTTNASKASAAGDFHEALHNGGLTLLDDPNQRRELMAFRATQNPRTLTWSLSAPPNEHDDIVIADILAWRGVVLNQTQSRIVEIDW